MPSATVQADEAFKINAKAAFAVDAETGKILYDQDGEKTMGIASITKIIGLILYLNKSKKVNYLREDKGAISDYAEKLSVVPDVSNVPLHKENDYTVKELVDSAFIQWPISTMVALAEKVAGSESKFLELMKKQLKDWGIKDATIVNASGLNNSYLGENRPENTGETDENQLSAKDVAIVARHLILDYPEVLKITSTTNQTFGENTVTG